MINSQPLLDALKQEYRRRFLNYKPYPKQREFHNCLARQSILSGANRSGKTFSSCQQAAFHATGCYPDWYEGIRLTPIPDPNTGVPTVLLLAISTDATSVRDNLQKGIIGSDANNFTDGAIDRSYTDLDKVIKRRGVNGGAIEQVTINRVDGGVTVLKFRSYAQGRQYVQGFPLDWALLDEEPPLDIFGEIQGRLADRIKGGNGYLSMAFTPLMGMTPLVQKIWKSTDSDVSLITMSMYDSPHLDPEEMIKLYRFLPDHVQKARMEGIPAAGSGRVYAYVKDEICGFPPMNGQHLKWLGAFDFGRGSHWNIVLYGCYDEDTDMLYITHIIKTKHKQADQIANLMKKYNNWCPVAYPHDMNRSTGISRGQLGEADRQSEGFKYRDIYEKEGINMMYEHAKNAEGSMGVEVGIAEVNERFMNLKIRIAPHLVELWDSLEIYRRDEMGNPIKDGAEDECDALRYLIVSIRHAMYRPSMSEFNQENGEVIDDTDVFE